MSALLLRGTATSPRPNGSSCVPARDRWPSWGCGYVNASAAPSACSSRWPAIHRTLLLRCPRLAIVRSCCSTAAMWKPWSVAWSRPTNSLTSRSIMRPTRARRTCRCSTCWPRRTLCRWSPLTYRRMGRRSRCPSGCPPALYARFREPGQLGVASSGPGKILIAGEDGIAEVDHINRTAVWRVPIRGSHGKAVLRPDGSIMFARRHGIGVVSDGSLAVVAGGFPDRCSLFTKSDGSVWVLDPINEALNQVIPTVVRLGERLGEEERHEISPPPPWPVGAAWLDDERLVLGHQSSCSLIGLGAGPPEQVHIATSDCVGVVPLGPETLMTVSGHADLDLTDMLAGRHARLGGSTVTAKTTAPPINQPSPPTSAVVVRPVWASGPAMTNPPSMASGKHPANRLTVVTDAPVARCTAGSTGPISCTRPRRPHPASTAPDRPAARRITRRRPAGHAGLASTSLGESVRRPPQHRSSRTPPAQSAYHRNGQRSEPGPPPTGRHNQAAAAARSSRSRPARVPAQPAPRLFVAPACAAPCRRYA
jgi:hypothetical protein